jgi:HD-GYP domain-containing protein (c-di-GMP phosphodiesterase class II)
MARSLGEQLGLPDEVLEALSAGYEHWDGRGWPGRLKGQDIPLAARIAPLAEYLEVANRIGGLKAAKDLASEGRAGQFDPALVDIVNTQAEALLSGLDTIATWDVVIAAEPALSAVLSDERVESALMAVANFVDLKSPYFLGHSQAVADLAGEAATALGMAQAEARLVRRAGLLQGLGRLGISNAIWDKRGPLGQGEWERVRLQPYLTERMLRQSEALAPVARVIVQFRERLDGSGYPLGLTGSQISHGARVLAAADAYQAMCEPRPHREARSSEEAAAELRSEVKAGRYDGEAVEAVLAAAGHRVFLRREGPAGLTAREVEVLKLLARGLSNKEIAERLFISPKTVANHVEHIYVKIDASNRAAASLFTMQHGLLPELYLPAIAVG